MQDQDIPVSGEPYIKKSKLLSLAKEYLFDPLMELFTGKKKKESKDELGGEINVLNDTSTLDLEQVWEILQKAFDEDKINEEQYMKAHGQYMELKKSEAIETIKKGFDAGLVTEEQYLSVISRV